MQQNDLTRWMSVIDRISLWTARVACWLTLVMMALLLREIVGRYLLNAPTGWVGETNQYLLCAFSMLGGAYCISTDSHIRVDIFWRKFGARTQAAVELAAFGFSLAFLGVIFWMGVGESWEAFIEDKRSMSIFALPLWPSLLAVALGTFLMLLQLTVRMIRNVLQLITGTDQQPPVVGLLE
ncbi:MAG: TRAP transporter small permease subunit [Thermodesulfobacteriota bacterium]